MGMGTLHPNFIVGIGGSAGALNAYKALLEALPSNTGMAFVIVSHIRPTANSQLAQILSSHTKMPVMLASRAMPIRRNHVYVIPPNADLRIASYTFKVVTPRTGRNKQIDLLFISLAEAMGARAIGIILSGYDGDGTEGCKHIKANGGTNFAQDMSAEVNGMPLSAQASGCVDFVLPPDKIPDELQRLVRASATKKKRDFDPKRFLATIGEGRQIVLVAETQTIFTQGDAADAVFYIQKGKVKLTVVSENGKEATIGVLNPGDFCGEGGLAGQLLRMGSAVALTDCELMRIDKKAMVLALRRENALSELFTAFLLGRNIRYEADLVDHLFSSAEKRLARILLLLANFGKEGRPETVVPKINQETLAGMTGTTRSRVSFFMNKFRKLGFIRYNGGLEVHSSLINVVLHGEPDQGA
jgi:CRP/FNR family transcriptional regulator, cyclic AMP receptor protein